MMGGEERIVYIVDDDLSLREALSSLVRSVGLSVQTFATARDFLRHPRPDCAACLVLDVRMPGLSGLDLQRQLAAGDGALPIIFITGHGDIPMTVRAMKAGAVEFLAKPFHDQVLLEAIAQSLDRDAVARRKRAVLNELRARHEALTPREREVFVLVARGLLNKQVAHELGISEITVKVHRRKVMEKMAAASLPDLVRMAARLSLRVQVEGA